MKLCKRFVIMLTNHVYYIFYNIKIAINFGWGRELNPFSLLKHAACNCIYI